MKTTEHNITGTILRAGTGTEGRVTVEIETTRDQLRDFPFNMIGKSAIAFIADSAPKPETPIPNDDGWIPHRPGDAMPCDGDLQVFIRQKKDSQIEAYSEYRPARDWIWSDDIPESAKIIAWKSA